MGGAGIRQNQVRHPRDNRYDERGFVASQFHLLGGSALGGVGGVVLIAHEILL